jgi:predicted nucleic acid-binding protein
LAISLRRTRQVKLPDALVAGTALHHGLELLTLDRALLAIVNHAKAQIS